MLKDKNKANTRSDEDNSLVFAVWPFYRRSMHAQTQSLPGTLGLHHPFVVHTIYMNIYSTWYRHWNHKLNKWPIKVCMRPFSMIVSYRRCSNGILSCLVFITTTTSVSIYFRCILSDKWHTERLWFLRKTFWLSALWPVLRYIENNNKSVLMVSTLSIFLFLFLVLLSFPLNILHSICFVINTRSSYMT